MIAQRQVFNKVAAQYFPQHKDKFILDVAFDSASKILAEFREFILRNTDAAVGYLVDKFTPTGVLRVMRNNPVDAVEELLVRFFGGTIGAAIGGGVLGFPAIASFIVGSAAFSIIRDAILNAIDDTPDAKGFQKFQADPLETVFALEKQVSEVKSDADAEGIAHQIRHAQSMGEISVNQSKMLLGMLKRKYDIPDFFGRQTMKFSASEDYKTLFQQSIETLRTQWLRVIAFIKMQDFEMAEEIEDALKEHIIIDSEEEAQALVDVLPQFEKWIRGLMSFDMDRQQSMHGEGQKMDMRLEVAANNSSLRDFENVINSRLRPYGLSYRIQKFNKGDDMAKVNFTASAEMRELFSSKEKFANDDIQKMEAILDDAFQHFVDMEIAFEKIKVAVSQVSQMGGPGFMDFGIDQMQAALKKLDRGFGVGFFNRTDAKEKFVSLRGLGLGAAGAISGVVSPASDAEKVANDLRGVSSISEGQRVLEFLRGYMLSSKDVRIDRVISAALPAFANKMIALGLSPETVEKMMIDNGVSSSMAMQAVGA